MTATENVAQSGMLLNLGLGSLIRLPLAPPSPVVAWGHSSPSCDTFSPPLSA
jgi:hypothetical protein